MTKFPTRFLVLALTLVSLLFAGCGGGGGGGSVSHVGTVTGTVYSTTGATLAVSRGAGNLPLAGATIRVVGATVSTTSGADGTFTLTQVPTGAQTLVVSTVGFQSVAIPVTVIAGGTVDVSAAQPATARKWSILVYMNADNNLEEYGIQDINEMERVADSDEVSTIVQMDRTPGYDSSNGDWTTTRRYLIRHDNDTAIINSTMLQDLGELNMGDPQTLNDFIAWGKANYPAEHYLLVIWNHGSGWRSSALSSVTRDISFDDSSGGAGIRTIELPAALATSPPLDIVAFDACFMQMIEVAYEMRNNCDYVVGSEEETPGEGYRYDTWLGPLVADPAMSPADLSGLIVRETVAFYKTAGNVVPNIEQSAIDTRQLPALAAATSAFAGELIKVASVDAAQLAQARNQADYYTYLENKDLYHYAALVNARVSKASVKTAADNLMAAIDAAVIEEAHGSVHPNAHGVAVFIPEQSSFARTAATYLPLQFALDTKWNEWLYAQKQ